MARNYFILSESVLGFLRYAPKGVSEEEFYDCLRFNVNRLSILQLGLTLTNQNGDIGITWEFNFRGFDHISDMEGVSSLDSFLKNKGFDFEKLRNDGIAPEEFTALFLPICRSGRIDRWITFHGSYDIAYLMKLLNVRSMATSMAIFAANAQQLLGTIVDLKYMARFCDGLLNGELGLNKLAKLLDVKRIGTAHFAGSDSLLTASVFAKMKTTFKLPPEQCEGFLYGLPHRIRALRRVHVLTPPLPPPKCSLSSFARSSPVFVGDFLIVS